MDRQASHTIFPLMSHRNFPIRLRNFHAQFHEQEGYALTTLQSAAHLLLELPVEALGLSLDADGLPVPLTR